MHYTYQCDQLTLYLSVPLLVYFNKLQNSSEIATSLGGDEQDSDTVV